LDVVADKKPKCTSNDALTENQATHEDAKFDWFEAIKEVLTEKSELTRKKLEKNVVKKYRKLLASDDSLVNVDKLGKKLNKKLEKYRNYLQITRIDANSDNDLIKLNES
jgi:hypothetical protein